MVKNIVNGQTITALGIKARRISPADQQSKKLKIMAAQPVMYQNPLTRDVLPIESIPGRFDYQGFYNACLRLDTDFLFFPKYSQSFISKIEPVRLENEKPYLLFHGSQLSQNAASFQPGLQTEPDGRLLYDLEMDDNSSKLGYCILNTDLGNYAVSIGIDRLIKTSFKTSFDKKLDESIKGIFVLAYCPNVQSYIRAIHQLFYDNQQLKFVLFVNPAVNLCNCVDYKPENPDFFRDSALFHKYYTKIEVDGSTYYTLNAREALSENMDYLSENMCCFGQTGLFCRKNDLIEPDDWETAERLRYGKDTNYYVDYRIFNKDDDEDDEADEEYQDKMRIHYSKQNDSKDRIVHLTSPNKPFTNYLLRFEFDTANNTLSFKTPQKKLELSPEAVIKLLDRQALSLRLC